MKKLAPILIILLLLSQIVAGAIDCSGSTIKNDVRKGLSETTTFTGEELEKLTNDVAADAMRQHLSEDFVKGKIEGSDLSVDQFNEVLNTYSNDAISTTYDLLLKDNTKVAQMPIIEGTKRLSVISDIHLSDDGAKAIVPLLDSIPLEEGSTVVFNGDYDGPGFFSDVKRNGEFILDADGNKMTALDFLNDFKIRAENAGVKVLFLIGNHDVQALRTLRSIKAAMDKEDNFDFSKFEKVREDSYFNPEYLTPDDYLESYRAVFNAILLKEKNLIDQKKDKSSSDYKRLNDISNILSGRRSGDEELGSRLATIVAKDLTNPDSQIFKLYQFLESLDYGAKVNGIFITHFPIDNEVHKSPKKIQRLVDSSGTNNFIFGHNSKWARLDVSSIEEVSLKSEDGTDVTIFGIDTEAKGLDTGKMSLLDIDFTKEKPTSKARYVKLDSEGNLIIDNEGEIASGTWGVGKEEPSSKKRYKESSLSIEQNKEGFGTVELSQQIMFQKRAILLALQDEFYKLQKKNSLEKMRKLINNYDSNIELIKEAIKQKNNLQTLTELSIEPDQVRELIFPLLSTDLSDVAINVIKSNKYDKIEEDIIPFLQNKETQIPALTLLVDLKKANLNHFIEALKSDNPKVVKGALELLRRKFWDINELGNLDDILSLLPNIIYGSNIEFSRVAMTVMTFIPPSKYEPVYEYAANSDDKNLRILATVALGKLTIRPDLMNKLLTDIDDAVVLSALFSSSKYGSLVLNNVLKNINHDSVKIRIAVAEELGKFDGLNIVDYLKQMLTDDVLIVRDTAQRSLKRLGIVSLKPIIDSGASPVVNKVIAKTEVVSDEFNGHPSRKAWAESVLGRDVSTLQAIGLQNAYDADIENIEEIKNILTKRGFTEEEITVLIDAGVFVDSKQDVENIEEKINELEKELRRIRGSTTSKIGFIGVGTLQNLYNGFQNWRNRDKIAALEKQIAEQEAIAKEVNNQLLENKKQQNIQDNDESYLQTEDNKKSQFEDQELKLILAFLNDNPQDIENVLYKVPSRDAKNILTDDDITKFKQKYPNGLPLEILQPYLEKVNEIASYNYQNNVLPGLNSKIKAEEPVKKALEDIVKEENEPNFYHGSGSGSLLNIIDNGLVPFGQQDSSTTYTGELVGGIAGVSQNYVSVVEARFIDRGTDYALRSDSLEGWSPESGKFELSYLLATKEKFARGERVGGGEWRYTQEDLELRINLLINRIEGWNELSDLEKELISNPFSILYGIRHEGETVKVASTIPGERGIESVDTDNLVLYVPRDKVELVQKLSQEKGKNIEVKSFDKMLESENEDVQESADRLIRSNSLERRLETSLDNVDSRIRAVNNLRETQTEESLVYYSKDDAKQAIEYLEQLQFNLEQEKEGYKIQDEASRLIQTESTDNIEKIINELEKELAEVKVSTTAKVGLFGVGTLQNLYNGFQNWRNREQISDLEKKIADQKAIIEEAETEAYAFDREIITDKQIEAYILERKIITDNQRKASESLLENIVGINSQDKEAQIIKLANEAGIDTSKSYENTINELFNKLSEPSYGVEKTKAIEALRILDNPSRVYATLLDLSLDPKNNNYVSDVLKRTYSELYFTGSEIEISSQSVGDTRRILLRDYFYNFEGNFKEVRAIYWQLARMSGDDINKIVSLKTIEERNQAIAEYKRTESKPSLEEQILEKVKEAGIEVDELNYETLIPQLVEVLKTKGRKSWRAKDALELIGKPAISLLIENIDSIDNSDLIDIFKKIGDPVAIDIIISMFPKVYEDNLRYPHDSLRALSEFGSVAEDRMIEFLKTGTDVQKQQALIVLKRMNSKKARPLFEQFLSDSYSPEIRKVAILAMEQDANVKEWNILISMYGQNQIDNKNIISALSSIPFQDDRVIEILQNVALNPEYKYNAVYAAAEYFEKFKDPLALKILVDAVKDPETRDSAARYLLNLGYRDFEMYKELLNDDSEDIRRIAIRGLGYFPESLDILIDQAKTLNPNVPSSSLKYSYLDIIIEQIIFLGGDNAAPLLEELLMKEKASRSFQDSVIKGIARVGNKKLINELISRFSQMSLGGDLYFTTYKFLESNRLLGDLIIGLSEDFENEKSQESLEGVIEHWAAIDPSINKRVVNSMIKNLKDPKLSNAAFKILIKMPNKAELLVDALSNPDYKEVKKKVLDLIYDNIVDLYSSSNANLLLQKLLEESIPVGFISEKNIVTALSLKAQSENVELNEEYAKKHNIPYSYFDDVNNFDRILREGNTVAVYHQIRDGMGDELIRVANLIQALKDKYPNLKIILYTNRPKLYSQSEKFETKELSLMEEDFKNNDYDMTVQFDSFYGGLNEMDKIVKEKKAPIKMNMAQVSFSVDLDIDGADIQFEDKTNVYSPGSKMLAYLGLPMRVGTQQPVTDNFIVAKEDAEANEYWDKNVVSKNNENRKVTLFNGFGGQRYNKGYTSLDQLSKDIGKLIDSGEFIAISPNDKIWGTEDIATQVYDMLTPEQRKHAHVLPGPSKGYTNQFVKNSDKVVTVEGGMMHFAYNLGKPMILVLKKEAGSQIWVPYFDENQHVINGIEEGYEITEPTDNIDERLKNIKNEQQLISEKDIASETITVESAPTVDAEVQTTFSFSYLGEEALNLQIARDALKTNENLKSKVHDETNELMNNFDSTSFLKEGKVKLTNNIEIVVGRLPTITQISKKGDNWIVTIDYIKLNSNLKENHESDMTDILELVIKHEIDEILIQEESSLNEYDTHVLSSSNTKRRFRALENINPSLSSDLSDLTKIVDIVQFKEKETRIALVNLEVLLREKGLRAESIEKIIESNNKLIDSALKNKEESRQYTALDGVLFVISRYQTLLSQNLVNVDYFDEISLEYFAFRKSDFSNAPDKATKSKISFDIAIDKGKPFVYEVKKYPRLAYGSTKANRNQALKYQKAIEDGLIDGASIELSGRIDANFMKWAVGESVGEFAQIKDIEIVYSMLLPSGSEYRFILKSSESNNGLDFNNDNKAYTKEDWEVVNGIHQAILDGSIIRIITSPNIENMPAEFIKDPFKILSAKSFIEYENFRNQALWKEFKEKKQIINKNNKLNSVSDFSESYLENMINSFQDYLNQNPEVAKVKKSYMLSQEQRVQVFDLMKERISKIRDYEISRQESPNFDVKSEQRRSLEYAGFDEGSVLDLDHIMMDAIQETNKKPGKKGRNYDNPERFKTLEQLTEYLNNPDLDRFSISVTEYDPETGKTKIKEFSNHVAYNKAEFQMIKQNEKRFSNYLQNLPNLISSLDPQSLLYKELISLQKGYQINKKKIESIRGDIKQLLAQKGITIRDAPIKSDDSNIKTKTQLSNEYNEKEKELLLKLVEIYDYQLNSGWEKNAKQIVEKKEQNIIKFIYIINADGEMVFDEEVLKGVITGRAAHSELSKGRNVYGAGEIVFEKRNGKWVLVEINNGSGHFRPPSETLPYAKNILEDNGVDVESVVLKNSLLRGVPESSLFGDIEPAEQETAKESSQSPLLDKIKIGITQSYIPNEKWDDLSTEQKARAVVAQMGIEYNSEWTSAIEEAHKLGEGDLGPRVNGLYLESTYSNKIITEKNNLMKEVEIPHDVRKALLDYGVVGNSIEYDSEKISSGLEGLGFKEDEEKNIIMDKLREIIAKGKEVTNNDIRAEFLEDFTAKYEGQANRVLGQLYGLVKSSKKVEKTVVKETIAEEVVIPEINRVNHLGVSVSTNLDSVIAAIEEKEGVTGLKNTLVQRRGEGHHLSIMPPTDSKIMKENPDFVKQALAEMGEINDLVVKGIGKVIKEDKKDSAKDKVSYYLVVDSQKVREFREKLRQETLKENPESTKFITYSDDLSDAQKAKALHLHLTLGFVNNDVFNQPKVVDEGLTSGIEIPETLDSLETYYTTPADNKVRKDVKLLLDAKDPLLQKIQDEDPSLTESTENIEKTINNLESKLAEVKVSTTAKVGMFGIGTLQNLYNGFQNWRNREKIEEIEAELDRMKEVNEYEEGKPKELIETPETEIIDEDTRYQLKAADEKSTFNDWKKNVYNFWIPRSIDIKRMFEQTKSVSTNKVPVFVSVGSGTGIVEYLLAKKGAEVICVDPDKEQIELAIDKYDLIPHKTIENVWVPNPKGKNAGLKFTFIKGNHVTFKDQIKQLGINTIEYPSTITKLEQKIDLLRKEFIAEMGQYEEERENLDEDTPQYEEKIESIREKMQGLIERVYKPMYDNIRELDIAKARFIKEDTAALQESTGKYVDALIGSWIPYRFDYLLDTHGSKLIYYATNEDGSTGVQANELNNRNPEVHMEKELEFTELEFLRKGIFFPSYSDKPMSKKIDSWETPSYNRIFRGDSQTNNIEVFARNDFVADSITRGDEYYSSSKIPKAENIFVFEDELYILDKELIEKKQFDVSDEKVKIEKRSVAKEVVGRVLGWFSPISFTYLKDADLKKVVAKIVLKKYKQQKDQAYDDTNKIGLTAADIVKGGKDVQGITIKDGDTTEFAKSEEIDGKWIITVDKAKIEKNLKSKGYSQQQINEAIELILKHEIDEVLLEKENIPAYETHVLASSNTKRRLRESNLPNTLNNDLNALSIEGVTGDTIEYDSGKISSGLVALNLQAKDIMPKLGPMINSKKEVTLDDITNEFSKDFTAKYKDQADEVLVQLSELVEKSKKVKEVVVEAPIVEEVVVPEINKVNHLGVSVSTNLEGIIAAIEEKEGVTGLRETLESRRGTGSHITIMSPTESKIMKENPDLVTRALQEMGTVDDVSVKGIGKVIKKDKKDSSKDKVTYFLVIESPKIEAFRTKLGFKTAKQEGDEGQYLHLTLGFVNNDVFGKAKVVDTSLTEGIELPQTLEFSETYYTTPDNNKERKNVELLSDLKNPDEPSDTSIKDNIPATKDDQNLENIVKTLENELDELQLSTTPKVGLFGVGILQNWYNRFQNWRNRESIEKIEAELQRLNEEIDTTSIQRVWDSRDTLIDFITYFGYSESILSPSENKKEISSKIESINDIINRAESTITEQNTKFDFITKLYNAKKEIIDNFVMTLTANFERTGIISKEDANLIKKLLNHDPEFVKGTVGLEILLLITPELKGDFEEKVSEEYARRREELGTPVPTIVDGQYAEAYNIEDSIFDIFYYDIDGNLQIISDTRLNNGYLKGTIDDRLENILLQYLEDGVKKEKVVHTSDDLEGQKVQVFLEKETQDLETILADRGSIKNRNTGFSPEIASIGKGVEKYSDEEVFNLVDIIVSESDSYEFRDVNGNIKIMKKIVLKAPNNKEFELEIDALIPPSQIIFRKFAVRNSKTSVVNDVYYVVGMDKSIFYKQITNDGRVIWATNEINEYIKGRIIPHLKAMVNQGWTLYMHKGESQDVLKTLKDQGFDSVKKYSIPFENAFEFLIAENYETGEKRIIINTLKKGTQKEMQLQAALYQAGFNPNQIIRIKHISRIDKQIKSALNIIKPDILIIGDIGAIKKVLPATDFEIVEELKGKITAERFKIKTPEGYKTVLVTTQPFGEEAEEYAKGIIDYYQDTDKELQVLFTGDAGAISPISERMQKINDIAVAPETKSISGFDMMTPTQFVTVDGEVIEHENPISQYITPGLQTLENGFQFRIENDGKAIVANGANLEDIELLTNIIINHNPSIVDQESSFFVKVLDSAKRQGKKTPPFSFIMSAQDDVAYSGDPISTLGHFHPGKPMKINLIIDFLLGDDFEITPSFKNLIKSIFDTKDFKDNYEDVLGVEKRLINLREEKVLRSQELSQEGLSQSMIAEIIEGEFKSKERELEKSLDRFILIRDKLYNLYNSYDVNSVEEAFDQISGDIAELPLSPNGIKTRVLAMLEYPARMKGEVGKRISYYTNSGIKDLETIKNIVEQEVEFLAPKVKLINELRKLHGKRWPSKKNNEIDYFVIKSFSEGYTENEIKEMVNENFLN